MKSFSIKNIYKKIKFEKLGINENDYNKILTDIKTAFDIHLDYLFIGNNKENSLTDNDYIQLFSLLFDKNIELPVIFSPKNEITINEIKKTLISELKNININLKPLFQNNLNIKVTSYNSTEILACSKVTNRNNKNKIKYLTVQETKNHSSSTSYELSNSELPAFTDSHVIHYESGNIQTEIFGLGTYNNIFQKILRNEEYKESIVKRVFEVVQNKDNTNTRKLPKELNSFAEQLTHLLFIVEMQRNNATLFTAPMFLELITQNSKYLNDENFFPVAAQHAVAQARWVSNSYPLELPNTHSMDYDTKNIKPGLTLLRSEGNILIEWFNQILKNTHINNINQKFNAVFSLDVIIEKKIDIVSIKDIISFVENTKKLNNSKLFSVLEKTLNTLLDILFFDFGERNSQYLLLYKEALLKKTIFSKKVKDLIENTFFEFQKILPKLDSFLVRVQADLKKDIKKIIPEILRILCAKIKEWYNIDAPEYITSVKTVEAGRLHEI